MTKEASAIGGKSKKRPDDRWSQSELTLRPRVCSSQIVVLDAERRKPRLFQARVLEGGSLPFDVEMIGKFNAPLGTPLPGFRFKPGECVVNFHDAKAFCHGKCTREQFDAVIMLISEVGIDAETRRESYRLLYYSPFKQEWGLCGTQRAGWRLKAYVESDFELCDYPEI